MTLADMNVGNRVTIVAFQGDTEIQRNLYQRGLFEGDSIQVVARLPLVGGAVILTTQGTRIALSRELLPLIEVALNDTP